MKKLLFGGSVLIAAASLIAADAKNEITSAAKKLADAGSYSWKQTVDVAGGGGGGGGGGGRFRPGPTEGKIAKDGTTHLAMTRGDNTIEAVLKGEKGAIKTQDGWQSWSEAADAEGPTRFIAGVLRNFKAPAAE